jgi:predicted ATPase
VTDAMPPRQERIASVRVRGIRTAADTKLVCEPMTVLIGPNGVGKSTLIEALEILHKIPSSSDFIRALNDEHGGPLQLMRRGETEITLDVDTTNGAYDRHPPRY